MGQEVRIGSMTEKQYINTAAIICHVIVEIVLSVAYLIEVFKGAHTMGYLIALVAIMLVTTLAELVLYKKRESNSN